MNLLNPIKTKLYYSNGLINDIKKINDKRKRHNPSSYIEDEKLNTLINGSFVLFDKGKLKQVNILINLANKPEQHLYQLLKGEDIKIIKLSEFDKKTRGIIYKYKLEGEYFSQFKNELYINLKWWEYLQIQIDRKDTCLHKMKLLDIIVISIVGSIITILIGWLL